MTKYLTGKRTVFIGWTLLLTLACNPHSAADRNKSHSASDSSQVASVLVFDASLQIGSYVVTTFEDSRGHLWFGTLEKGVAKYDGDSLRYLTVNDGLPSNRIVDIVEDDAHRIWFGTGAGIAKFDGESFTNYSIVDGLINNMISCLHFDSKGDLWIGTWGGVSKFDGLRFDDFPLPYPELSTSINPDTKDWITTIEEDRAGNIWIGRDGYGASRFDGSNFQHFTRQRGLNSNFVQAIVEDPVGNIWIGTRVAEKDDPDANKRFGAGGLNQYDGQRFLHFPHRAGLSENDVYAIYLDPSDDLWFGTTQHGVYQLTNNEFIHYPVPASTMDMVKDQQGNMWLGCAGGLYRIDSTGEIANVTINGPWN